MTKIIQDVNFEQVVQGYVDDGYTVWIERDQMGWEVDLYHEKTGNHGSGRGKTIYNALVDAIYNIGDKQE